MSEFESECERILIWAIVTERNNLAELEGGGRAGIPLIINVRVVVVVVVACFPACATQQKLILRRYRQIMNATLQSTVTWAKSKLRQGRWFEDRLESLTYISSCTDKAIAEKCYVCMSHAITIIFWISGCDSGDRTIKMDMGSMYLGTRFASTFRKWRPRHTCSSGCLVLFVDRADWETHFAGCGGDARNEM